MPLELRKLQRRVKLVNTIENALLELYVEIRDRSMDDLNKDESVSAAHEDEKNSLEKKALLEECNGDMLVVLDHLRAKLRIQLVFKEDYERELKGSLDRKQSAHVKEVEELKR